MATFHDRTLAPKFQGRLLRGAGPCRVLISEEMVAEVETDQPEEIRLPASHPDEIGLVAARTLHSRRALAHAFDHGFALLDALDLPPLALDVIDDAIAHLDALDAPDEDREPWLAGYYNGRVDVSGECESDDCDDEEGDPAEETSLETAGRGFVRCGADDDEDGFDIEEQHDAEQTYEDGSEDDSYPWRFQPDAWALVAETHHV